MPVKRRTPKNRKALAEELTPDRLSYLIHGILWFTGDVVPFADDNEMEACWRANRDEVMAQVSDEPSTDTFQPGTRPSTFWKFEHNRQRPTWECAELEALGELSESERTAIIRLARVEWERRMHGLTEAARERAERVTDESLLAAWPHVWAVEF